MLSVYSPAKKTASRLLRAPLLALGFTLLLLVASAPVSAAETTTSALPPLGMSVGSIPGLTAAGAAPRYASYWVGDWMATSGWGGFDNAMKAAKAAGATPVVYWYYWGDSIAPTCFDADGCNGRNEAEWNSLTDQLVSHIKTTLGGAEALVVIENEFNKGGITGDFAPTFDAKLEKISLKLKAAPGVKLVVGFGAWGETNWAKFPKTIAASEYVGFQTMRASTKDTEASYRAAADRAAYFTNFIAEKFNKPSFLYDLALSSYPDDHWKTVQAETLNAIFSKLVSSGNTGLQGVVYRSINDNYMDPVNYYGLAESHWGLRTKDGVPKPAFDVWVAHAKGSGTMPPPPTPEPTPTPTPATQNVPGAFEGESLTATKGGVKTDAAASGGKSWNLWANGEMSKTLVSDSARRVTISVAAQGQLAGGVMPHMEVRLAGATLGAFNVAGGSYQPYTIEADLAAGSTNLVIAFTNDAVVGTEDRNLLVDLVSVKDFVAPPPPPPPTPEPTNAPPTASFAASVTGLTASFDASASSDPEGAALSYAWSFGDSTSGAGATATHAYAAAGTYTVTLTVSDGNASATATKSVTAVQPNRAPIASFTASANGLTAAFDASASSDPDGDALAYSYQYGDGSSGSESSHVYAAAGTYRVTLTVSDGKLTASAAKDIAMVQPNRAPVARATATGANDTYAFDASGSSDADGDAMTFAWSFGDGTSGIGARVSHTYATAGSYTATVTATDARGLASTATVGVSATKPAPTTFDATFTGVKGNNYWVQVSVAANKAIAGVCASVDGAACKPLTKMSYGYSASFYVANGADVVFRATSTTGDVDTSGAYDWPSATPVSSTPTPPPAAPSVKFTPYDGNTNWVQARVETSAIVKSVCVTLNGGACKALTLRSWGAWAAGVYAPTGTKVVFQATLGDGTVVKSATYTWPVK